MKLLDKRVINRHTPEGAPICGFVSYVHPTEPVLMRRMGWEIGDDVHDDLRDSFSHDNGRTWSVPRAAFAAREVEGGFLQYIEFASYFHAERDLHILVTNQKFEKSLEGCDLSSPSELYIQAGNPLDAKYSEPIVSDFGHRGMAVSFCVPILDGVGRVLVPVQWKKADEDGEWRAKGFPTIADGSNVLLNVWDSALFIGEFQSRSTLNNALSWRVGKAVPFESSLSSRGMMEGALTELQDGTLAMVLRGSNAGWDTQPGYKWLTFSHDGGETWSEVQPFSFDDGETPQSGSSGSSFFRSRKTDQLYWMGNLCQAGQKAQANFPRSPLVICEVQEKPFALKKSTLFVVDERAESEDPGVQLSNFKFYLDRESDDLVLHLTRYGERGAQGRDWMRADQYQYRVALH